MAVNVTKKTETAKVETKTVETKTVAPKSTSQVVAAPVKEAVKKEETGKVDETVKKEEKAVPAKKQTRKKTTKKGAKRGPKPASERTVELFVQYGEKEVSYTDLVNRIKDMWKAEGKRETSLKTLNIYVKPEESKAYYVINDKITGDLDF